MTRQPSWVTLCHLPEKRRKEIAEEMKDRNRDEREDQRRKRNRNESEEIEEMKNVKKHRLLDTPCKIMVNINSSCSEYL